MKEKEKKQKKISIRKRLIKILTGVFIGALLGFLYYKFFGCTSGCAISSNPYISTIYGSVSGLIITII